MLGPAYGSDNSELAKIFRESSASAKLLSSTAIFISMTTLIVMAYFSYKDYSGDEQWKKDQLTYYQQMLSELKESNSQYSTLNDKLSSELLMLKEIVEGQNIVLERMKIKASEKGQ